MRYDTQTALVTGASSGIGRQFALDLAARGSDLVLVARRADRLDELADTLRRRHGVTVTTIPLDLARPHPGQDLRSELDRLGITVTLLINNAGFGATGPFTDLDPALHREMIAVNATALTDITGALLPGVLAAGDGAIVNVASFVGHQPGPGMAVYAATKAYVLNFGEALAHELRDHPVKVLTLSPASTRTEFYTVSGTSEKNARFETPQQVVATALRALDRTRTPARVVSGRSNRLALAVLHRLPRRAMLTLMAAANQRSAHA
ncbi:SDR family NAD(P)-dependent oxidoreductase [Actinoplanes sp. G11-F43]|uniref:SDR family NAD(P)-dependent oxidoreductase n=1 Tax=Actinoplanes sp. G11-F43 TaxID=3424130 RepID=UPI003D337F85